MEEDGYVNNNGFQSEFSTVMDLCVMDKISEKTAEPVIHENLISIDSENSAVNCFSKECMVTESPDIADEDRITQNKPLAYVLPAKYQNVDVREFYPEFRENATLRFLRLGLGKKCNNPDIWRSVRKRSELKKKNKKPVTEEIISPESDWSVESDEEKLFLQQKEYVSDISCDVPLNNSWRFGPAKLWYDMVEVPETAETYDYGFKLKQSSDEHLPCDDDLHDDAFLMVAQQDWENDVIWDGDEVKEEVMKNVYNPNKIAGWVPINADRTVSSYREHLKPLSSQPERAFKFGFLNFNKMNKVNTEEKREMYSIFPEENPHLLYDRWEDDVIWDYEAMNRISGPKNLEINDSNIILEIPEDLPSKVDNFEPVKDHKDRKYRPIMKQNEEEPELLNPVNKKSDFYNISNDEYYNSKMTEDTALKLGYAGSLLPHSIPALELHASFFPTYMGPLKLRRFHRPALRQYSHGPLSQIKFHGVYSLTSFIKEKKKQRQRELEESGGGEMFFMRTPYDLSGKDAELVLFEFSEEHPPLMNQIGMASRVRNYYRRKPGKDSALVEYKYGETTCAHTSPFLGSLLPGQSLQAYENNLFRSPIYEHATENTDFLIIRTRTGYFIREVETVFTVGQQLPLVEVPAPKSEKANNFIKDFLMVFIYRLFWKSEDNPRRIKMEDIRKAFPSHREFNIRKRLNLCADFQRTGFDSKFWVLKSSFRLPGEDEIREIISAEQCCAYYSMLAAEQRLKDAGYGDKFLLMDEEETDNLQNKIDDEVKAAPWNTTQAFISAVRGKCLLDLLGAADPTGCGEGFSYVKIPNKPQWIKEENNILNPAKRLVKGTDADLRRLSLSSAKKLLKTFNVPEHEIKKLTRWQIIDVVRTLSTEQAKLGEEGVTKFARGNFFSQAEHLRKYKEECQRLFDLQNRVLSSNEVLSTDEDSSSEGDSDLEEMGKHLESIISNKKSLQELSHECEEAERKELQKLMTSESTSEENQKCKSEKSNSGFEGKILRIYRTYQENGYTYERVETVRKSEVIKLYTKIRDTKDEEFIKNFALDEARKEECRRERRRLQDQLRRLRRKELKERETKEPQKKKVKIESPSLFKVKCGACGATGHMRTNKACPLYQSSPTLPPIQVAMTEEQEEAEEKAGLVDQNLIKLDETKIIVSKQLLKRADEVRRKALVLKIPKEAVSSSKKKRNYEVTSSDYMSAPKFVNRKRIDPVVSLSVIFENLINEIKSLPDTQPFWFPVSVKQASNYHSIITKPMDLQTMREKARKQQYKCRKDFLADINQILENSSTYNGNHSFLTITAHTMLNHCIKNFTENEEKLMQLEKAINPLLDDDQVAFSFILERIVSDQLKAVPESWPFHKPVDKRSAKGYYEIIKNPMDLDSIIRNCKSHKYKTRSAFLCDVELIFMNSKTFNGAESPFTKIAQNIVNACKVSLEMYEPQLQSLELGIKNSENSGLNNITISKKDKTSENQIEICSSDNFNGSADIDSCVDVESVGSSHKSYEKENMSSDRSDFDVEIVDKSRLQISPYEQFPLYDCHEERSNSSSPPVFSESQSLLCNGIQDSESIGSNINILQHFPPSTCDNICDDLILSESESDNENELHF
ncbi:transcription initiation factor TFIID subunit 1-like [Stegodyphus dumicola]|uniref:transcription initiation factor TFIID subunit 1-like n=1 Tax=Stegodyphus dumicola TaxID=202533 RepID=UPI0015AE74BC|nr:transcription initiation factor TFIID subunit 1-like [Stegodyphus dumicola]